MGQPLADRCVDWGPLCAPNKNWTNMERWLIVGQANKPFKGSSVSLTVTITLLGQPCANRCGDRMTICAPNRGPIYMPTEGRSSLQPSANDGLANLCYLGCFNYRRVGVCFWWRYDDFRHFGDLNKTFIKFRWLFQSHQRKRV